MSWNVHMLTMMFHIPNRRMLWADSLLFLGRESRCAKRAGSLEGFILKYGTVDLVCKSITVTLKQLKVVFWDNRDMHFLSLLFNGRFATKLNYGLLWQWHYWTCICNLDESSANSSKYWLVTRYIKLPGLHKVKIWIQIIIIIERGLFFCVLDLIETLDNGPSTTWLLLVQETKL